LYIFAMSWRYPPAALLDGEPIVLVAAEVGFFDQAHFTRQFKRHVGIPPGRYAVSSAAKA
jgi:AraC-like DNA-binding protein